MVTGTNAVLEDKGAEVDDRDEGLPGRARVSARTGLSFMTSARKAGPPLVPRTRAIEVDERLVRWFLFHAMDVAGSSGLPRHPNGRNVAIAVCFLHSYANLCTSSFPAVVEGPYRQFVATSHEILPQFRGTSAFNTTALNAYIGPL
jgi:N-methylhydantoinase A/oxoprolinase/acetone carboxylase beta subunit